MTFEEFFAKKKIDLTQLEKAEPGLYAEFKSHFSLMGEKSFDHTKKFWFNKLRHLYHLAAPIKEVVQPATSPIATQAEPLNSPTIEQQAAETPQAIVKPAFKPRNIPAKTAETQASEEAPVIKKPAFKPRNIKPADAESFESIPSQNEAPNEEKTRQEAPPSVEKTLEAKPAYKPKFNIKTIAAKPAEGQTEKSPEPQISGAVENEPNEVVKPAYKPRFKMKNVSTTKPAEEPAPPSEESASSEDLKKENPVSPESPKSAYKPKFSMKNIQAAKLTEELQEQKTEIVPSQKEEQKPEPEDKKEEGAAKPAYKPRFNMKNIKPKSEE